MKVLVIVKGFEFSLEVGTKEPIIQLKNKIQHFLGIPTESQTLQVYDWELLDGQDLDDYLISEGTKIHLSILESSKLNITLKLSTKTINMEVDTTDTVHSLKEKIHIVDGTPINRMALCYCGMELQYEFGYLREYGIQEGSEINVVFKKTMNVMVSRKVCVVVQTSSSLLNGAKIPIEMEDTSRVSDVREALLLKKVIPVDDYIFVHKQRIMRDDCTLRWHGVEDGDFLYVFKGTVTRDHAF